MIEEATDKNKQQSLIKKQYWEIGRWFKNKDRTAWIFGNKYKCTSADEWRITQLQNEKNTLRMIIVSVYGVKRATT